MREATVPEGYLTLEDAAGRLGVSRTKVWRLVKDGVLIAQPDVLDNRRKLIAVADLDRLLQSRSAPKGVNSSRSDDRKE